MSKSAIEAIKRAFSQERKFRREEVQAIADWATEELYRRQMDVECELPNTDPIGYGVGF